ncbi:CHASE domain-containing protein [Marinobacter sp. 1-3A]|uniref:CHASE domain-containing protein n=1 Tax=Marinobacter sp. 1-3A TaxID=2582920 RepID=UPI001905047A|nr:CHASE domain-containing protein [Marinobacter sp. 1-3A]MBK1872262.1 CHASE domain-containing protein [Marinobacter sp. 1-3A]
MGKTRGAAAQITKLHWIVICLSFLLTVAAWQISSQIADARAEDHFDQRVEQLNELLMDRMQKYEFALISGAGAIRANNNDLSLTQWRQFAEVLAVQDRLPGVRGIGVIKRVPERNLEAYLAEERKERPGFRVHPPHTGSDFWPITYLEPLAGNEAAIGLDMAHESNRFTAAQKAMRTGQTQITGPIALVQDDEKKPGFLFFHPFYRTLEAQHNDNREADFLGLVYAPFLVSRLMEGTLANTNRLLHFQISDGEHQLYSEFTETGENNYDTSPMFQTSYSLDIYGREWQFDVQTTRLFDKYNASRQPAAILVSGLIINGLILLAFLLLSNGKRRAEQEVIEKTAELNMQKLEAESAVKVKTAFLANMSHEIRTPMNAIIGMLVLLKEAHLNDYSRRLVSKAFLASEVLLQLLNDILDLSRIEADHIELDYQPFEIEALVQRSVELFAITAEEKGLKLRVNIAPSTPRCVTGDLMRISQICTNLVGNAIKFTQRGSVTVSIGFSSTDKTHGVLEITVKDTGIGIREEDQQRVFENFRQADESTSRVYGGSGLGLSISSHLAKLMGATLTLESAENQGATFTLMLPVTLPENEESIGSRHVTRPTCVYGHLTPSPQPLFNNLRVLIVDDVQLNCEIVTSYLSSFGVQSESVHNGADAMRRLESRPFDLVLMDLHLDGETGQDIASQIRRHQGISQPIIAALSASISEHDRSSAYSAGMNDYLTKPVLPGDIQRLLQAFFKEHVASGQQSPPAQPVSTLEPGSDAELPDFISRPAFQTLFGADPELFKRCRRSFLASSTEMIAALEHCLLHNDSVAIKAIAHKIKGAAANIANTELAGVADKVEKAAESGQSTTGPETLLAILVDHTQQLSEMDSDAEPPALANHKTSEPVNRVIERMMQRLGGNRIASDDDIDQVLGFLSENGETILASRLRRAFETYKFSEAIDLLSKIKPESRGS